MSCKCGCGEVPRKGEFLPGHWAKTPQARPTLVLNGHISGSSRVGSRRFNWQGDSPTVKAVHLWLRRYKVRTGICERCGMEGKRTEFHNISSEYRRDVNDYIELCCKCHRWADKNKEALRKERDMAS